jgi:hypothetical protein
MSSIAHAAATVQTNPQSVPATPLWFGDVALIAQGAHSVRPAESASHPELLGACRGASS